LAARCHGPVTWHRSPLSGRPKTMATPVFIEQHPASGRYAILEDSGATLWLYLTAPGEHRPIADAWVFNRVRPLLTADELTPFRDAHEPPPILEELADDDPVCPAPSEHTWSFAWTGDGEAVAVFCDDLPVAFVQAREPRGFSRHVIRSGPWGV